MGAGHPLLLAPHSDSGSDFMTKASIEQMKNTLGSELDENPSDGEDGQMGTRHDMLPIAVKIMLIFSKHLQTPFSGVPVSPGDNEEDGGTGSPSLDEGRGVGGRWLTAGEMDAPLVKQVV